MRWPFGFAARHLYSVDVLAPRKATRLRLAFLLQALACGCSLAVAQQAAAGPPLHAEPFPLEQVRRGLHGTAWTVFEGTDPEPMDVEILGRLTDAIGPGQDMILGRLHGAKPEFTGVVAGMSGSPVYVDGKLLGALSFRIGQFSKEPICGITPIGLMLEVRDLPARAVVPAPASSEGLKPIATPLVFSGFGAAAMERYGQGFRDMGLEPVAGLGSAAPVGGAPGPAIVPGSAVSAVLARGDLNIAATCTVTYVDATQLLACGHPITQYGTISVPMTKAEVLATLPSPMNAFKIVNTTETVGAFTEDRQNAIAGRFGVSAPMIPVMVEVATPVGSGLKPRSLKFEVLNNRELTPQILLAGIFQSLSGTDTAGTEMSLRLRGEVVLRDYPAIRMEQVLSSGDGGAAAGQAAVFVAQRFARVYANALREPVVTGVMLHADLVPVRQSVQVESAQLSTDEARPGDTVTVEATVRPWQQPARVVRQTVTLPTTLEAGPLRILVGDAASLDRVLAPPPASAAHPLGVADTVAQLNRAHPNDRLYVTLLDHETQAVTASDALPALPPSMVNALQPLRESREISFTSETARVAGSVGLDGAVSGSQVLTLRVR